MNSASPQAASGVSTGNRADAEDIVQEAWFRLARQEPGSVDNVAGWLTTVVGRLSIDALRSRAAKQDPAKMTAGRARRKLRGATPAPDRRQQRAVVDAFLAAARDGDFNALLQLLDPDLVWEVRTGRGATSGLGRDDVVRVVRRGDPARVTARRVLVNGQPGILAWGPTGRPIGLMACTVENGRLTRIDSLVDPARLASIDVEKPA